MPYLDKPGTNNVIQGLKSSGGSGDVQKLGIWLEPWITINADGSIEGDVFSRINKGYTQVNDVYFSFPSNIAIMQINSHATDNYEPGEEYSANILAQVSFEDLEIGESHDMGIVFTFIGGAIEIYGHSLHIRYKWSSTAYANDQTPEIIIGKTGNSTPMYLNGDGSIHPDGRIATYRNIITINNTGSGLSQFTGLENIKIYFLMHENAA